MESDTKNKFWDLKPYWCQPWSIVTFGILVLIFSWILFSKIIITSILGFLVVVWWVVFLILAPSSYTTTANKK